MGYVLARHEAVCGEKGFFFYDSTHYNSSERAAFDSGLRSLSRGRSVCQDNQVSKVARSLLFREMLT
jgi:hypothetical protein